MPYATVRGNNIYYEVHGNGPETVVFAHGLLYGTWMWDKQVAHFKERFRCVVYDHRGQGNSDPGKLPLSMEELCEDAADLIRQLQFGPCHFVGLSMGGFVGMRLAARHPELVKSLALLSTSHLKDSAWVRAKYKVLTLLVEWFGPKIAQKRILAVMFSQKFLTAPEHRPDLEAYTARLVQLPKTVTRAVKGVLSRPDFTETDRVEARTLVLVAEKDKALPARDGKALAGLLPNAHSLTLPCGHMSNLEMPDRINALLDEWLGLQRTTD
jgi:pimeloyl-ACP methyl ester carboxylesterase